MNRVLSGRLQGFSEAAKAKSTGDLFKLARFVRGMVEDSFEELSLSNEWYVMEDAATSIEECANTGAIRTHLNIPDGEMSWSTEEEGLTLLQYLLVFHRRAFLFLTLVPVAAAKQYLFDKSRLVRCLARWRLNAIGT